MSLPNDQATRLGGALLTGGGGISAAYANLPNEILTRTLFDYEFFDFTNPVNTGKSVASDGIGLASVPADTTNIRTLHLGWSPAKHGSAVYTSNSGEIHPKGDWGHALALSPGSAVTTGWNATRSGLAAASGTLGLAGGIVLGNRSYPRRLAFGGSVTLEFAASVNRCFSYFGLSSVATAGDLVHTAGAGTYAAANGLILQLDPGGSIYVVGRQASAGTKTRVAGMSFTAPTAVTQWSRLDFVVVGEYTNPAVSLTFGQLDVYLRNYIITTTTSTTRPPANFTKYSINATTATAINLPLSTIGQPLYPMVGACQANGVTADAGDYWSARSLWYALERS